MKAFVINIIIVILLSSNLHSQEQNYNHKIKQLFFEANEEFSFNNYSIALPLYKQLFEIDSTSFEVNYKLGICIFLTKRNKLESVSYFKKASDEYVDAFFYLGRLYRLQHDFTKSLEAYNTYKNAYDDKAFDNSIVIYFMNKTITAQKMINNTSGYEVNNMGSAINTAYPEYGSLVTTDETRMYFTSRRPNGIGNKKDPNNEYFEDIYISQYFNDKWKKPINAGEGVNTNLHDATVCLTNDNKSLYLYRTNNNLTGGDIYTTQIDKNKFTIPKIIEAEINSKEGTESCASLSPDQKTIYFSSNRIGGYGGKDIYKVVKLPNNQWSKATNLGTIINTRYDDDAPFIHADGVTLYFSSKGHKNMGGYDIYKTVMDENEIWSFPENLGTPINSVSDDIFFLGNPEGTSGYFSSNRTGGFGASDIYKVAFPEVYTENFILKGRVISENNNNPLKATITIVDYDTKELQGIYRTNEASGKYIMVLLPHRHYKLIVEAEGYRNLIDDIDMTEKLRVKDLFKNIRLELIDNKEIKDEVIENE